MNLEGSAQNLKAFALAPGLVDTDMQASIRAAKINQISDIPRDSLLPPTTPALVVAWLAAGFADALAGQFVDVRQEGLLERAFAEMKQGRRSVGPFAR